MVRDQIEEHGAPVVEWLEENGYGCDVTNHDDDFLPGNNDEVSAHCSKRLEDGWDDIDIEKTFKPR